MSAIKKWFHILLRKKVIFASEDMALFIGGPLLKSIFGIIELHFWGTLLICLMLGSQKAEKMSKFTQYSEYVCCSRWSNGTDSFYAETSIIRQIFDVPFQTKGPTNSNHVWAMTHIGLRKIIMRFYMFWSMYI